MLIISETNIAHNDEDNSEHKMKVRGWKPVGEDTAREAGGVEGLI